MLFRVSRAQETRRTNPGSHVFGNELCVSSENVHVYDSLDNTPGQYLLYKDLLRANGSCIIIPKEVISIVLGPSGVLSFQLSPICMKMIEDALEEHDRHEHETSVEEDDEEDEQVIN